MAQIDLGPNEKPLLTNSPPNAPLSSPGWNLGKTFRSFRLLEDAQHRVYALPVIVTDPQADAMVPMGVYQGNLVAPSGSNAGNGPWVFATTELYKPSGGVLSQEMQRTPDTFKQLAGTSAAGQTAVWTPAAGKKVRIMGGNICISKEAACAGALTVGIQDNAGAQYMFVQISAAALVATGQVIYLPFSFPGNGFLSAAVNNPQYLNLSAALTAGLITVNMWGTEE
jgi:hypothetical protein